MNRSLIVLLSAGTLLLGSALAGTAATLIIVDENGNGTINGVQLPSTTSGTDNNPPPHTDVLTYGPMGFNGTAGSINVFVGQTPGVIIRFNGDGLIRLYAGPNVGVNDSSAATKFLPPIPPFPVMNTVSVNSPGSILSYTPTAGQPGYDATATPTYIFLFSNTTAPTNILNPVGSNLEDAYQVSYASNLNIADAVVNITNAGSSAASTAPSSSNGSGNICANVYVYQPNEHLLACCSCNTTPNSLNAWPVIFGSGALLANSSTKPTSVVIKLVATTPGSGANGAAVCDPTFQSAPYSLTTGLSVRGTRSHRTPTTDVTLNETLFQTKALSTGEAQKLQTDCTALGSGGTCPACTPGGFAVPAGNY
ncbi:MAG: hypothetical protein JO217_03615 [Acidobacteriaceae bacterium]|nr:hypothetical protein [Acidobacteriaceae bacterium]